MAIICRPFITLRNGKKLFAREVGRKAFCFEVKNAKASLTDQSKSETDAKLEGKQ